MPKIKIKSRLATAKAPVTKPVKKSSDKLGLLKHNLYPRSFRLKGRDIAILEDIVAKVKKLVDDAGYKTLNDTAVIRALIHIGAEIPAKKVLERIKETLL